MRRDDDDDDARAPTRREVARYGLLALTLPLWRDLIHDLGFFEGEDDLPCPPGSSRRRGPDNVDADHASWRFWCIDRYLRSTASTASATTSGYVGGT